VRFILGHTLRLAGNANKPQNTKGYVQRPVEQRFWEKVDKAGAIPAGAPKIGPCWLWVGIRHPRHHHGRIAMAARGGTMYAHRVSWELHFGPIAEGMDVCHRCDNPPCVNPAHLFLATHVDKVRDMQLKRWSHLGEASGVARLTEADVHAIRTEHVLGTTTFAALARRFGVSRTTISNAITRKTWSHVA
jgi:hypothetical protein